MIDNKLKNKNDDEFENKRVEELIDYGILDSHEVAELDEITKLTSMICETPIAVITLLDHTRVWCISKIGIDQCEYLKENSMCQYVIQQDDLLIVQDLLLDDRYTFAPIEEGGPGYRFYAGMPLITSNGYRIGTLCVIDNIPRNINDNQKFLLQALSKQVITNFELRKNNKELLKLNGRIQLYKEKEEFYSNMSHELRTPLNAISGFTELLSKTELDEKQQEYVRVLKSSTDILISIVNDILDYSKIDSGNLKIEKLPFNLMTLIKNTYELLKIKAQEKNVYYKVDLCKNIPLYIIGDKLRLNQILINLLGNAIKFTNKGFVELKINITKDSEKEVKINFCVKDTGIGIPSDKLKDIFDRFYQVEGMTRVFGGSGLGLSIAKNLVELQGGTIEVRSELGKFSEFSFSLTYQIPSLEETFILMKEECTSECLSKPDFKDIKILLAEDNLVNVKLIQKIFERTAAFLDVSQNGKFCIEKLKQRNYDLILMDIFMPEMDGCEATHYIRNIMKLNIPIIALTANISELNRKKCLDVGINDYVSKPFKVDDLFRVINKCLKNDKESNKKNESEIAGAKSINCKLKNTVSNYKSSISLYPVRFFSSKNEPINVKLKRPRFITNPKLENFPYIAQNISQKDKPSSTKNQHKYSLSEINVLESLDTIDITHNKIYLEDNTDVDFDKEEEKIDMMYLKEYSGNDIDFEKELIDVFIQEIPEHLKDLENQVLKLNYEGIKKAAHKIKSPLGIFGLDNLNIKFEKIEKNSQKFQIIPIIKLFEFCKNNLEKILNELKSMQ